MTCLHQFFKTYQYYKKINMICLCIQNVDSDAPDLCRFNSFALFGSLLYCNNMISSVSRKMTQTREKSQI